MKTVPQAGFPARINIKFALFSYFKCIALNEPTENFEPTIKIFENFLLLTVTLKNRLATVKSISLKIKMLLIFDDFNQTRSWQRKKVNK